LSVSWYLVHVPFIVLSLSVSWYLVHVPFIVLSLSVSWYLVHVPFIVLSLSVSWYLVHVPFIVLSLFHDTLCMYHLLLLLLKHKLCSDGYQHLASPVIESNHHNIDCLLRAFFGRKVWTSWGRIKVAYEPDEGCQDAVSCKEANE